MITVRFICGCTGDVLCCASLKSKYALYTVSKCTTQISVEAFTNLNKLNPLYTPGADGHHGEADGGTNNAVSARDGQFEKGCNELPYCRACR